MREGTVVINKVTYEHGDPVTCKIFGKEVTDAKISIDTDASVYEHNYVYICQNVHTGKTAMNKLGYKYSRNIGTVGEINLSNNSVSNLSPKMEDSYDIFVHEQ
jgi:hypothetical protein